MAPSDSNTHVLPSDLSKYRKGYKLGPPRPPNAWILYRSEKLKAIAAGERFENLEAILLETRGEGEEGGRKGGKARRGDSKQKGKLPVKAVAKGKKEEEAMETGSDQEEEDEAKIETATSSSSKTVPQAEISKVISLMWKREKKEEKARFEKMAQAKKIEVNNLCSISAHPMILMLRGLGHSTLSCIRTTSSSQ